MPSQTKKHQASAGNRALIVTALPVEFRAVCEYLEETEEIEHREGSIYKRGLFDAHGSCWEVVVVEAGKHNVHAALETERAIREFEPRVALFVGVAAGLKDVTVGDVVAASEVYNYESGKEAEEFLVRPKGSESSYRLMQRARAEARSTEWIHRIKNKRLGQSPRAWVGPIVAGEKVLANTQGPSYQRLRKQYNDALAAEMEGSGFMAAAKANTRVDALVIRGISDLVDGKSESDSHGWQDSASGHASAFAFEVLSKLNPAPSTAKTKLPGQILLALLVVGIGYFALNAFASRQPKNTTKSIAPRIEGAPKQQDPSSKKPPSSNRPRPSLMGPVRTAEQLRAITAVSLPTGAADSTTLEHLAPGQLAFIQPWNISPTAETTPQRTSRNIFEVHRLKTGQFILVGVISQGDANALKAGARHLSLYPSITPDSNSITPDSNSIIGIPFELIRSTQVQRSAREIEGIFVELAAP
jgi:nucleoside phosphorylase